MQKVISINLNGNAYQLDESGYETLRDYLAGAERALADNPDRAEIIADLEQAIADKCQRYLGPHKTRRHARARWIRSSRRWARSTARRVTTAIERRIRRGQPGPDRKQDGPPRRLYRIPDGAMIAGVCNGLAAYFQIDVTLVRVVFLLAALLTKGVGIMAYVIMMFVIPEARHRGGAGRRRGRAAQREGRDRPREEAVCGRPQALAAPLAAAAPPLAAARLASTGAIGVRSAVLGRGAAAGLRARTPRAVPDDGGDDDLAGQHRRRSSQWRLPEDVPVWAGALILLIGYQIAVSPLRAVQHWTLGSRSGRQPALFAFWNAVIWLVGMAFGVWIASNHMPEIREFLQRVPELFRDFMQAIKDLVKR